MRSIKFALTHAIYAPFERLTKETTFLSEMHARRFRFMALFGDNAAQPFLTRWQAPRTAIPPGLLILTCADTRIRPSDNVLIW